MYHDNNDFRSNLLIGAINLIGACETSGATQAQWMQGAIDHLAPAALTILTLFYGPSDPNAPRGF